MTKQKRLTIKDCHDSILTWIETNIDEQPRLDDLAARIGYSKRMIQIYFKEIYGMSIGEYISNRRLYRACGLLRLTELTVSEIALMLKYDNHHNFCRAFKKKLHCTPLAFRRLPQELLPAVRLPKTNHRDEFAHHLVTFTKKALYGVEFQYQDQFTKPGLLGGPIRLQRLRSWFTDSQAPFTIASDIVRKNMNLDARNELITVNAIAGLSVHVDSIFTPPKDSIFYPLDGLYLCCPFYGSLQDYAEHNKDIYRHLLPQFKYTRREARDVEIFHFTHHVFDASPRILCEHYIPIMREVGN